MCGHTQGAARSTKPTVPAALPARPVTTTSPAAAPSVTEIRSSPEMGDVNGALKADATALDAITSGNGFAGVSRFGVTSSAPSAAELAAQNQARLDTDMLAAQESIVSRFGTVHIAPLSLKVKQFPEEGSFMPAHLFDVVGGMGFTLARVHEYGEGHAPNINEPDLLFYVPADPTKPALGGSFTDLIADGDYVLSGWGYYADYTPGATPVMIGLSAGTTVPENEWFIHEAGYHTIDGGFEAFAPQNESWRGELAGAPPTSATAKPHKMPIGAHGRVWDLHVFRSDLYTGEDSAPTLGILAPEAMSSFYPTETLNLNDGFFFPENPENQSQPPRLVNAPSRLPESTAEVSSAG